MDPVQKYINQGIGVFAAVAIVESEEQYKIDAENARPHVAALAKRMHEQFQAAYEATPEKSEQQFNTLDATL